MKKTSAKKLKIFPFYHFKNSAELQKFLRTKYKNDGTLDFVDLAGILYTQHEYDISGKEISYQNKRTGLGFIITTANRYSPAGFTDAEVSEPASFGCFRNDIVYAD